MLSREKIKDKLLFLGLAPLVFAFVFGFFKSYLVAGIFFAVMMVMYALATAFSSRLCGVLFFIMIAYLGYGLYNKPGAEWHQQIGLSLGIVAALFSIIWGALEAWLARQQKT